MLLLVLFVCSLLALVPVSAFAVWTPIITAADFTGIMGDVQTTATGIISVLLIVLGVGLLARIFSR